MTQNVVTYTVEINTDNSDGKLVPYQTANVKFEVERRTGVLMVPNAALRWTPQTQQVSPQVRKENASGLTQTAAAKAVKRVIDWFCGGAADEVIVGMVEGAMLDDAQLKRLQEKIALARKAKAKTSEK